MATSESDELRKQLDEARIQLALAIKLQQDMLSAVSHDLRAPVRHIVGMINSLHRCCSQQLDEQARMRLDRVKANAERLTGYIDS